jgi:Zn-dependent M32 family carboxypeptidase
LKARKKKTEAEMTQLQVNRVKLESAIVELRSRTEQIKKENRFNGERIKRVNRDIEEVNHDIQDKMREAANLRRSTKDHLISTEELELIRLQAIKDRLELTKKKEHLVEEYRESLKSSRVGNREEESFIAIPEEVILYQKKLDRSTSG